MKAAKDLSHAELVEIVDAICKYLFLEDVEVGTQMLEQWNPDKEWNGADLCGSIATMLGYHGLVPEFVGDEPRDPDSRCDICGGPNH